MPDPAAPVREIGYMTTGYGWWSGLDAHESTPELTWPHSVDVYDRMRRQDSQVASVLRAVMLPVIRTDWRIDPAGAKKRVTKHVAEDLGLPIVGETKTKPLPRARDRFSWTEHLRLALLMLTFGHSYFEQVYRIDDETGLAHLRKLAWRPPRTISQIMVARDGGLEWIEQWMPAEENSAAGPVRIPVDRLVAYVNDREGSNWLGTSLLRPAYKHWLIKDRLLRVQAQTVERNGMGVPLYKGADGEQNLSGGLGMAASWRSGEASGAAVPYGADLVLRGVEGDLPDADTPIRYHDEQIARAVLAHFLNLGTQTGSWALGSTFADFFTLSLQTLAQLVADVATQHVVEDLVDLNWGPDEPAPRIIFEEIGSRQVATAQAVKALMDAGALGNDRTLEESLRQQFGLPPKDEDTAEEPPAPPTPPQLPPGTLPPATMPDDMPVESQD